MEAGKIFQLRTHLAYLKSLPKLFDVFNDEDVLIEFPASIVESTNVEGEKYTTLLVFPNLPVKNLRTGESKMPSFGSTKSEYNKEK